MSKKIFVKCILFLMLLCVILTGCLYVLEKPKNSQWDASGLEYVHKNRNFYDVLVCGTSIAVMNVNNEELYSEYGIAAMTLGEPEQPTYLSYYTLEEALQYQSPKVVFFDINSLFYSEEKLRDYINRAEDYNVHLSIDKMRNYYLKYKAVKTAQTLKPELDIWDYFSKTYYTHSNWQSLSKDNFIRKSGNLVMNGNYMSFNIGEGLDEIRKNLNTEYSADVECAKLEDFNIEYLQKIIDLCKEKDVDLVLLRGGGVLTYLSNENYNAISEIAYQNNIPFLDLSQCDKEIGFDWNTDSADGNHHNVLGTKKWTDYLGDYLISNYQFEDKRKDESYSYMESELERYQNVLNIMQTKVELLSAIDFETYIDELCKVDTSQNTIFIAVNDDGFDSLTEKQYAKLSQLGLSSDFEDKFRYSYVAVINNQKITEKLSDIQIEIEDLLENGDSYKISSGGYLSGISASMLLNGVENVQGGRGFNIIVYNKKYREILSNVFFDTYNEANPHTGRKAKNSKEQYEQETGVNTWREIIRIDS